MINGKKEKQLKKMEEDFYKIGFGEEDTEENLRG
jgi:hypothetical protein